MTTNQAMKSCAYCAHAAEHHEAGGSCRHRRFLFRHLRFHYCGCSSYEVSTISALFKVLPTLNELSATFHQHD